MSQQSYDDVLNRARQLPPEQQKKLVAELSRPALADNGASGEFRSLADALRDVGYLGTMTDAPSDLATNPKHMEGFGEHAD